MKSVLLEKVSFKSVRQKGGKTAFAERMNIKLSLIMLARSWNMGKFSFYHPDTP